MHTPSRGASFTAWNGTCAPVRMVDGLQGAWLPPVLWILGSAVVGLLLERLLMPALRRLVQGTRWSADDAVVDALRGMWILWMLLAGTAQAAERAPLDARMEVWVDNLLFIAAVLSVCVVINRLLGAYIRQQMRGDDPQGGSASIISNLTALLTYLLGGLVVLRTLGISLTPVLTALGVGGLAVALALQPTLSNLFSGLQLIASRQINKGDYVELRSGEAGHVVDISWRNTVLRSLGNNTIVVPNALLASAILINYQLPDGEMAFGVELSVERGSDLDQVEHVAVRTAEEVMRRLQPNLKGYEPSVRFNGVKDGNVTFTVGLRVARFTDQYLLRHEYYKAITKAFIIHGIELPIPRQTLYLETHGKHHSPTPADRGQPASLQDR